MRCFPCGIRLVLLLALLLGLSVPVPVRAADAASALRQAADQYQKLLDSPKKQRFRENWQRVFDRCLDLAKSYPASQEAAKALHLAGKTAEGLFGASYIEPDARLAVETFDRLAEKYPESSFSEDGLFRAGQLLENALKDPAGACRRYQRLVREYPRSASAPRARERLQALAVFAPAEPPAPKAAADDAGEGNSLRALSGIRFWSNPGYTRVVIDLDGPAEFSSNLLAADPAEGVGPRLYIDIAGVQPAPGLAESLPVGDGLLQQVRTGRPAQTKVRIVLDLVSLEEYKVFPLEDPFRIVVDVSGQRLPELKRDAPEIHSPPPARDGIAGILESAPAAPGPKVRLPEAKPGQGLKRIVVDAGHGGKDPGAIGPSGVMEKDITLALALALAKSLEKELGCEVVLTRDRDVFLPLEERTAIANKVNADLFISLHANASTNRDAYGIETYYLNFAKNDKAAAVVARENGTTLKQVGDLELILFDLMAHAKINESSRLAAEIHRVMIDKLSRHYSHVKDLGIRQGPFYVLLGATMPSVLVETAFISHKREESRLLDRAYQERTVTAIVDGVRNYANALKMMASR